MEILNYINGEWNKPDPLPPNRRTDLGEGECAVFMKTIILSNLKFFLPHCRSCSLTMGEMSRFLGQRGSNAQTHHA